MRDPQAIIDDDGRRRLRLTDKSSYDVDVTNQTAPRFPDLPRLPHALPRSGVSSEARLALRQVLGDLERALAGAARALDDVGELIRFRAAAVARIVVHVWHACVGAGEGCALFAIGGFGRGALFPHSDVDLLVLVAAEAESRQARSLEAFFACLWDIGIVPGSAVRTPAQCRALAAEDISVFTALLDARRLAGDAAMQTALATIVDDSALWPRADFLAAKRAEQAARHARYNDTTYNLEPNLKDGPGGLRTLDLMRWLGRRVAAAGDFDAMVAAGLLDVTERVALERAEAVLWRCRYALHQAAGRAEERLLFDHQRQLADALGYEDLHEKNLGVEQFMQGYYRAATIVERLGAQLIERYAELLENDDSPRRSLDDHFVAVGARLEPVDVDLFLRCPRAIVDAFVVLMDHPELRGLSAQTMRLLQQALASHDTAFADDRDVLGAFVDLLKRGAPAVEAIARMNRHGVLAALLPMFRRVVGRMQYDLFHVYTVDEHTVRVLRNVARFADASAATEFPLAAKIFAALDKPEVLLLAALFHDIAKGQGGDHSLLGEQAVRACGAKLELPVDDIERVAWLVRWHLLMSVTAQRQDTTDADVVHRFATRVEDTERLDLLYLLTIADIAGTNPKLWNEWKARLLADLYTSARFALRADLDPPPKVAERAASCRARAAALLVDGGIEATQAEIWLDAFPAKSFLRHRPEQLVCQARTIAARSAHDDVVVAVQTRSVRGGASELFVHAPDCDGVFATITAMLDRLGFDVADARLLISTRGFVFDTFQLLDANTANVIGDDRARELENRLACALRDSDSAPQVARRSTPRRLRHFQRVVRIEFSRVANATQLALVCIDQPGLLAHIAQAFRGARVRVHDARIATFGERAEDFFLLSDENDAALDDDAERNLREILERTLGAPDALLAERAELSKADEPTHVR